MSIMTATLRVLLGREPPTGRRLKGSHDPVAQTALPERCGAAGRLSRGVEQCRRPSDATVRCYALLCCVLKELRR